MAGLVCYYGGAKFHYLHVSHDETTGRHLRVMSALPDSASVADAFTPPIADSAGRPRRICASKSTSSGCSFAYRAGATDDWKWLPQLFDASILSDEATAPGLPNFTGAFVGMACQDLAGTAPPADFDYFEYRERDYQPVPRV